MKTHLHTAVVIGDYMYVFGGANPVIQSGVTAVNTFLKYDLRANTWEKLAPENNFLPCSRFAHTAVAYEGRMYIFGGQKGGVGGKTQKISYRLNDLWEYDPVENSFRLLPFAGNIPLPRFEREEGKKGRGGGGEDDRYIIYIFLIILT